MQSTRMLAIVTDGRGLSVCVFVCMCVCVSGGHIGHTKAADRGAV